MLHVLFSVYLKMLVLYSPFFVLSCFISLTRGYSRKEQRRLAWKVATATLVSSVLLYLFGRVIFSVFGICLLYTSPSPRDLSTSRMPSSA